MRADWVECTFDDVFFTTSGGTPSRQKSEYYNGSIPWVKSGELKSNIITETEEYISDLAVEKSSAKLFPKGTLLLALYGATIGKTAILGIDATTNQAICGIFETPYVFTKYTYYYLQNRKEHLIKLSTGGAQPNISQNIVKALNFPLPPLPEQRAIVKKIEALFSSLDAGIADLKKAQDQLKIYRQAVLKKAFEGRSDWESFTFKEVFTFSQGIQVDVKKQYFDKNDSRIRFLRIIDFTQGKEEARYIERPDFKYFVSKKDVSIVRYGASTGFICRGLEGVIANNLFRVIPKSNINLDYIYYYLLSAYFQNEIAKSIKGAAMPAISFGLINNIIFTYPSFEEQAQIVKEIEARLSVCDAVEQQIKDSLSQAEALRQSILKKAFEGKLLTEEEIKACQQAPDYEPASVLLEKIEANKPVKKTKKK